MRNTAGTEARHNFQKYLHQHFVMTVGDGRAQAFLLAHGVANEAMCTTLPLRFSFEVLGAGCVSLALRALRFRPQSPPPLSVPRKAAARPASLGCCGLAAHVPRSRESHAGPLTQGLAAAGRWDMVGVGTWAGLLTEPLAAAPARADVSISPHDHARLQRRCDSGVVGGATAVLGGATAVPSWCDSDQGPDSDQRWKRAGGRSAGCGQVWVTLQDVTGSRGRGRRPGVPATLPTKIRDQNLKKTFFSSLIRERMRGDEKL